MSLLMARPVASPANERTPSAIAFARRTRRFAGTPPPSSPPGPPVLEQLGRGHPILIVEDDPDGRQTLVDLLQLLGYRVLSAANGQEALRCLEHGPLPCLIVLDLMMPVMDGWEFRERQLEHPAWADVPVVVVSAVGDKSARQRQRLGPVPVLVKPVNVTALIEIVEAFCSPSEGGSSPPA